MEIRGQSCPFTNYDWTRRNEPTCSWPDGSESIESSDRIDIVQIVLSQSKDKIIFKNKRKIMIEIRKKIGYLCIKIINFYIYFNIFFKSE